MPSPILTLRNDTKSIIHLILFEILFCVILQIFFLFCQFFCLFICFHDCHFDFFLLFVSFLICQILRSYRQFGLVFTKNLKSLVIFEHMKIKKTINPRLNDTFVPCPKLLNEIRLNLNYG